MSAGKISPVLRPHREGIEALVRAGFDPVPVRHGKGDHLIVRIRKGGRVARVTISGSPRGSFIDSLLGEARRAIGRSYNNVATEVSR